MPDSEQTSVQTPAPQGLVPSLGPFITTFFVVGAVLGSGIFCKSGLMAGQLGSTELLMGVWVLAGIITLMDALINAEIAGMIPETGGQYVCFERMYGPFAAYIYVFSIDGMAASKPVAADVAERCFAGGGRRIAAVVMVSTFGAANGYIMSSARVYFSTARRNVFPRFLVFLVRTIYNDLSRYQAAVAQGKPAVINSASGTVLVLLGVPIYFYYRQGERTQP